jgi:hypothetical protein
METTTHHLSPGQVMNFNNRLATAVRLTFDLADGATVQVTLAPGAQARLIAGSTGAAQVTIDDADPNFTGLHVANTNGDA